MNTTNFLLMLLGSCLILCFILMLINKTDKDTDREIEGFDPVIDAIQEQLQKESPEQLKSTVQALQKRLIDYGYAQDLNSFVKKTELNPDTGKCLVNNAIDRDKYISKTDIQPPGPRIDLSQYVKKSSIPPEKICPPIPEIDYSAYVKKSTLPPNEKCPPCIAPKVKVSAGLCRECPPAPSCPPPERCPEIKCPDPAPCPPEKKCPEPAPCPTLKECIKCDEVRYIKVPAVITKTVTVDANGNVISQKIDSGSTNPNASITPSTTQSYNNQAQPTQTQRTNITTSQNQPTNISTTQTKSQIQQLQEQLQAQKLQSQQLQSQLQAQQQGQCQTQVTNPSVQSTSFLSSIFGSSNEIPTTTFPTMSTYMPNITLAQTLDSSYGSKTAMCPSSDLNSEFKSYGIYGLSY